MGIPQKTWDGGLRWGCDWWGVGFLLFMANTVYEWIYFQLLRTLYHPFVVNLRLFIIGSIPLISTLPPDFNITSRNSSQRMIWYPHMILCRVVLGCIGYKRAYEAWDYGNRNVVDTIGQTHIPQKMHHAQLNMTSNHSKSAVACS